MRVDGRLAEPDPAWLQVVQARRCRVVGLSGTDKERADPPNASIEGSAAPALKLSTGRRRFACPWTAVNEPAPALPRRPVPRVSAGPTFVPIVDRDACCAERLTGDCYRRSVFRIPRGHRA
jgi:hypothetical protein